MDAGGQTLATTTSIAIFLAGIPGLWIAGRVVLRASSEETSVRLFLWFVLGGLFLIPLLDLIRYLSDVISLAMPSLQNVGEFTLFLGTTSWTLYSAIATGLALLAYAAAFLYLRNKTPVELARFIHSHRPKDVIAQWEKLKNAQGLAFISPVYWLHFPAILKGWFERVFSYGDAYALTPEGWQGYAKGRVPLLKQEKALIINTTMVSEQEYKSYWELPMTRIMDEWGLRYPGVRKVEHVYFCRAAVSDDETRRGFLKRAYTLGKEFAPA